MADSPIRDVTDTAVMVAAFRARETRRPDALFRDPLAARVAGEEGQALLQRLPKGMFFNGWTVAVRTKVIDHLLQGAIAAGIDMVVNLGAGLDTRPYRLELPSSLQWVEVDHPGLIDLKEKRLASERPRCLLRRFRLDLSDAAARRGFLAAVAAESRRILVLTEGVTPYLTPEEVAALADDLRGHESFRGWIVDYFSPEAYRYRKKRTIRSVMARAPFRFEPSDYFGFFAAHGWQAREVRYLPEEGERWKRPVPAPFPARLWFSIFGRFLPEARRDALRKFAGFVLFEPAEIRRGA